MASNKIKAVVKFEDDSGIAIWNVGEIVKHKGKNCEVIKSTCIEVGNWYSEYEYYLVIK